MRVEETDNSIYEDVKRDLVELLQHYPKKSLIKENPKLDAELYICDDIAIENVKVFEKRLNMEYGYDEKLIKKFGISSLVKLLNTDYPAHYYKMYSKENWEQVNEQEKVKQRLDQKYQKWANAMKKRTLDKLKAKGIDNTIKMKIEDAMKQEILEAKKKLEYIKENFDSLDVRISEYEHRRLYTGIAISLTLPRTVRSPHAKKKVESILRKTLRKGVANILWFKEQCEDDKLSELQLYLKYATHAFGDVYYSELSRSLDE